MDDEEGEIFNNKYLADLKSGATTIVPTGRDSVRYIFHLFLNKTKSLTSFRIKIRLSELQQRNFIAAPHLRSTYIAQYGDQNLKEEDISVSSNNPTKMEKTFTVYRSNPDLLNCDKN